MGWEQVCFAFFFFFSFGESPQSTVMTPGSFGWMWEEFSLWYHPDTSVSTLSHHPEPPMSLLHWHLYAPIRAHAMPSLHLLQDALFFRPWWLVFILPANVVSLTIEFLLQQKYYANIHFCCPIIDQVFSLVTKVTKLFQILCFPPKIQQIVLEQTTHLLSCANVVDLNAKTLYYKFGPTKITVCPQNSNSVFYRVNYFGNGVDSNLVSCLQMYWSLANLLDISQPTQIILLSVEQEKKKKG